MQVKASQAVSVITAIIKAKLVPMLVGSPGCGKSQIFHQIAKEYRLKVIDLRLSQCDPTDLLGFPNIKGNKAGYVPMETFPLEDDPIPEGYVGWMLILDEFNSASPAVQAAAYKLVLDRMVGQSSLNSKVITVCAGNLETDNAIVNPMSTALQSRLVHVELRVDVKEWITWANNNGIHHKITDYIGFNGKALFSFQPDHTDSTYACPRTWEFLNRLIGKLPENSPEELILYSGAVSEGIAREFITFCKIYDSLPKMSQIEASPETVAIPEEPSVLYAITGSIAENMQNSNIGQLMKYIMRMPVEFQVITLKTAIKRKTQLAQHPAFIKWQDESAVAYY